MIKEIVAMFGGLTRFSRQIDVPKQTIAGWQRHNNIPHWRINAIKAAADRANIDITPFLTSTQAKGGKL